MAKEQAIRVRIQAQCTVYYDQDVTMGRADYDAYLKSIDARGLVGSRKRNDIAGSYISAHDESGADDYEDVIITPLSPELASPAPASLDDE